MLLYKYLYAKEMVENTEFLEKNILEVNFNNSVSFSSYTSTVWAYSITLQSYEYL